MLTATQASQTLLTDTELSIAQAILTPAIATMISDGEINKDEASQIANLCAFSPIYEKVDHGLLDSMIEHGINEVIVHGGEMAVRRACGSLSPAMRETALCFAIRIAMADGTINDKERHSLVETAVLLDIHSEIFEQILEVVAMMQRPAMA